MRTLWFIAQALLLPTATFAQSPGQEAATIARKLQSDWKNCVQQSAALGSAEVRDFVGPAENVFQSCSTEEQLFVAYVNVATDGAAGTILVSHYRDKVALKKKISDDYFAAMAKGIGKQ